MNLFFSWVYAYVLCPRLENWVKKDLYSVAVLIKEQHQTKKIVGNQTTKLAVSNISRSCEFVSNIKEQKAISALLGETCFLLYPINCKVFLFVTEK